MPDDTSQITLSPQTIAELEAMIDRLHGQKMTLEQVQASNALREALERMKALNSDRAKITGRT